MCSSAEKTDISLLNGRIRRSSKFHHRVGGSVDNAVGVLCLANGLALAASELLRDVFGEEAVSSRLVFGVSSLPLGSQVELEVILELKID